MSTKIKEKFTAALLHEADKAILVTLREASKLSEKDLMTLVIEKAMQHEDEILEIAAKRVESETAEREERRKANYELLKEKMKEARQAAKEARSSKSAPTKSEPVTTEA